MLFHSTSFPIFLAIVLGLYYCLEHRWQNRLLLTASYVFYAWWDWRFLGLLFFVTLVNFLAGLAIQKSRFHLTGSTAVPAEIPKYGTVPGTVNGIGGKTALWAALILSLGTLGFFKYYNFFVESANALFSFAHVGFAFSALNILLPVGISFFTFQAIAYTIDVYRGREQTQKNFWLFALYVSFFPQLVAGPIERSSRLIPQLAQRRKVDNASMQSACALILVGYFKKVFLADGVAPVVKLCFDHPDTLGHWALILGAWLFTLQIYGDFAGYTDIARGVSRLFGIELCLNFRQPYLSASVSEYWQRWHISLSTWLRDYLYIPLGGNRRGRVRTWLNYMITMLLGGLWHGAAWTYVVWGGLHGVFLILNDMFRSVQTTIRKRSLPEAEKAAEPPKKFLTNFWWAICVFITFNLISLTLIFFRSDSISAALNYLHFICAQKDSSMLEPYKTSLLALSFLFYGFWTFLIDWSCYRRESELPFAGQKPVVRGLLYSMMLFLIIYVGSSDVVPFIYFQF